MYTYVSVQRCLSLQLCTQPGENCGCWVSLLVVKERRMLLAVGHGEMGSVARWELDWDHATRPSWLKWLDDTVFRGRTCYDSVLPFCDCVVLGSIGARRFQFPGLFQREETIQWLRTRVFVSQIRVSFAERSWMNSESESCFRLDSFAVMQLEV